MNTASHDKMVKSIRGSFAVENMTLSEKSLSNLERLANGSVDIKTLIEEIMLRYSEKRV